MPSEIIYVLLFLNDYRTFVEFSAFLFFVKN